MKSTPVNDESVEPCPSSESQPASCGSSAENATKQTSGDDHDLQASQQHHGPVVVCDEVMPSVCGACGGNGNGGRWDKSLGVLCQKFVMLFLVTPVSCLLHMYM